MTITGKILRDAFLSAANAISNKKKEVDDLNVFPVPDGDTGTNMSLTIGNAREILEKMDDDVPVYEVADQTASAMLRGARGNSGVILSLIFRGFSNAFKNKKEADGKNIADALSNGVDNAYKSVMNPTEGTILTVARVSSEVASRCETNDVTKMWEQVCYTAQNTLNETPELLPTLKKAGVVDAGGKGLVIIYDAILDVLNGGTPVTLEDKDESVNIDNFSDAVGQFDAEIRFTYCTEMIIDKKKNCPDSNILRKYLEKIGDCVVVVEDENIIKVHVHTDNPGVAIEKALEFGSINLPKIENMKYQHEKRKIEQKAKMNAIEPAEITKKYGFVVVCAGSGIENLFNDLGADIIVKGGQTMNPSTENILSAIIRCPSEIVYVLPNNKNIIMAAKQAADISNKQVYVVGTRTIPQGMTAMLYFAEDIEPQENFDMMSDAIKNVSTGQITLAARNADFEGKKIKKDDVLALDNGKLAFIENDISKAAYKLTKNLIKKSENSSYVNIIYGSDTTAQQAKAVQEKLAGKYPNIDFNLIAGNQPIYNYIISVE